MNAQLIKINDAHNILSEFYNSCMMEKELFSS